jgi:hypothetical protein
MIDRLIEFSLENKFIVVALWIGIAAWGLWTMLRAPNRGWALSGRSGDIGYSRSAAAVTA